MLGIKGLKVNKVSGNGDNTRKEDRAGFAKVVPVEIECDDLYMIVVVLLAKDTGILIDEARTVLIENDLIPFCDLLDLARDGGVCTFFRTFHSKSEWIEFNKKFASRIVCSPLDV